MAYPGTLDAFPTRTSADVSSAVDHNAQSVSIVAIETELGLDPSGSGSTLGARLDGVLRPRIGADMYRAATGASDSGTTIRNLTGFDTVRRTDAGFTLTPAAGTVALPSAGWYYCDTRIRLSASYAGGWIQLAVWNATAELIRNPVWNATATDVVTDLQVSGILYAAAGTVLRPRLASNGTAAAVGDATGSYYYFRVVRLG